ncbi:MULTISPECIES: hypothetical protein [Exiguobacterium]|uniref:hypothetical protein n=1 Tax=Exiguobacterium TaxID=33986 RepID=UPI001BEBA2DE|nr:MULTISPECIES: hypothetical protein [Exiguobacterium]MCT4783394.1 hypothetical protein [Exiguobacterium himgiriensis]
MFDRIGDISIGFMFGIVFMLLTDSMIGLVVGSLLGIGFAITPYLSNRRSRDDMPQVR